MKINARSPACQTRFDLDRIAKNTSRSSTVLAVKPKDMVITMHICRGNFRSTWFSSGGYGPIAKTLFAHCPVDGFFLEYDTDRAGDFNPLHHIKDQKVVLGLVTSKSADLENSEAIKDGSKEASLVPWFLSPAMGCFHGRKAISSRLTLITVIARDVWLAD